MTDRPVRPRDAASLVVVRRRRRELQVLMGRRPAGDRFLPNAFVFPGGGVDREDFRCEAEAELQPGVVRRLASTAEPRRARALAVAAIRETWEETGLVFGSRRGGALRPDLRCLEYIARAVTPVESPIRYHARFFLAPVEAASGRLADSGELADLQWLSLDQAQELPIISPTRLVLEETGRLLHGEPSRGVPFLYYRRGVACLRFD